MARKAKCDHKGGLLPRIRGSFFDMESGFYAVPFLCEFCDATGVVWVRGPQDVDWTTPANVRKRARRSALRGDAK